MSLSRVQLFATPWTIAYPASPSIGFPRQRYWSGLPFPSPGDFLNPGIESRSPALQADALPSEPPGKAWCLHAATKKKKKRPHMLQVKEPTCGASLVAQMVKIPHATAKPGGAK